jgi:deazaflavin-dependent oxidoreductase (nitroreductase family)
MVRDVTISGMMVGVSAHASLAPKGTNPLHDLFRVLNQKWAVPMLSAGYGSKAVTDVTGSLLLLTTIRRQTGEPQNTPLGYAVVDGAIVVMSGKGPDAHWFRNALSDPRVEVMLPGARLRGSASPVTDPVRRRAAIRALLSSMPLPALTVGDVRLDDDARVDEIGEANPVLAITPTAILPGPFDPGGWAPRANTRKLLLTPVVLGVGLAVLVAAVRRHRR